MLYGYAYYSGCLAQPSRQLKGVAHPQNRNYGQAGPSNHTMLIVATAFQAAAISYSTRPRLEMGLKGNSCHAQRHTLLLRVSYAT